MLRPLQGAPHRPDEQLVRAGVRGAQLSQTPPPTLREAPDEAALEPLPAGVQVALVACPLAGFAVIVLAMWLLAGGDAAGFVAGIAAGSFVGGGKLLILAGTVEDAPVGHWGLAALIVYLDVATALVVMGGMNLLYRVPGAGPRIAAARAAGWSFLQRHPWTYHATWLSLAGFVAVPFNGTGALVGAFLGRMLGLARRGILTATVFGSAVGALSLALAGNLWAERINTVAGHPVLALVAVLTVAALAILASKWMFGERIDVQVSNSAGD